EKMARGSTGLSEKEPIRVALLRDDTPTSEAFAHDVFKELSFNGKSALDNGRNYREIAVRERAAPDAGAAATSPAEQLARLARHLILCLFTTAGRANMTREMATLEDRWTAPHRPRYLGATPFASELIELVGANAERRKRFLALTLVSTTPINARMVLH